MRPRGSNDWGNEDWRSENIRANHDITPDDEEREAELERWIARVCVLFVALGIWKLLDLACGGLGGFAGLIGWLLTRLA